MPEPKLPDPEVLRGHMATLGRLLFEHWPAAQQNSEARWSLVALAEMANALLSGDDERAAWLLDELEKGAER